MIHCGSPPACCCSWPSTRWPSTARSWALSCCRPRPAAGPDGFQFQIWTPDMQAGYRAGRLANEPLLPFCRRWLWLGDHRRRALARLFQLEQRPHAADPDRAATGTCARRWIARRCCAWLQRPSSLLVHCQCADLVDRDCQHQAAAADGGHGRPAQRARSGSRGCGRRAARGAATARRAEPPAAAGRRTLQMERRFTADAAHELRTPLAAIRANAQVLVAARDAEERESTATRPDRQRRPQYAAGRTVAVTGACRSVCRSRSVARIWIWREIVDEQLQCASRAGGTRWASRSPAHCSRCI